MIKRQMYGRAGFTLLPPPHPAQLKLRTVTSENATEPNGRWGCNFNGVTPETEETPVTDVTTSRDEDGPELSAADEQALLLFP